MITVQLTISFPAYSISIIVVSLKLCFPFNFNSEEGHEGEEDVVEEDDLEYDTKL